MTFEGFNQDEDILSELWIYYDFPGRPPKPGSQLKKRLFDKCTQYALYMDGSRASLSPDENGKVHASTFEVERRLLHNEIAVMTLGVQRSGMNTKRAQSVAEFAYEFARGIKFKDKDKYKNEY